MIDSQRGTKTTIFDSKKHQEKNTKVYPRYCMQFAKDEPKKVDQYLDFPDTTSSYERYCQLEITRDIKETICRVDYRGLTTGEMQLERTDYELPDGNFVHFDTARSKYSEYFFAPQDPNAPSKKKKSKNI